MDRMSNDFGSSGLVGISSVMFYLLRSVLVYPMVQLSWAFLLCKSSTPYLSANNQCFQGFHLVQAIMAGFVLISTIFYKIVLKFFLIDTNPWSVNPYARFEVSYRWMQILAFFVLPIAQIIEIDVSQICLINFDRKLKRIGGVIWSVLGV